jgi:hypothetical protein
MISNQFSSFLGFGGKFRFMLKGMEDWDGDPVGMNARNHK